MPAMIIRCDGCAPSSRSCPPRRASTRGSPTRSGFPTPGRAGAVVAICPASAEGLRRALRAGGLRFDADEDAVDAFLAAHDLHAAVQELEMPLLLLHAEGDEQVPVQHSRELAARVRSAG